MTALLALLVVSLGAEGAPSSTDVGMPATMTQLVIPGSELEVIPPDDKRAPLVVRIAASAPHGNAFRYDIVYYALEPGTYDLRSALRRKDGSSMDGVPPIEVRVGSVLPEGHILPNDLPVQTTGPIGGYRMVIVLAVLAWLVGLYAIVFTGRRRGTTDVAVAQPQSLADRLRPLVERGMAGKLDREERAALERSLIGYWRRRLELGGLPLATAFSQMRHHPEAGPLLQQLEKWLHQPEADATVNMEELLRPYRDLPADALESAEASA